MEVFSECYGERTSFSKLFFEKLLFKTGVVFSSTNSARRKFFLNSFVVLKKVFFFQETRNKKGKKERLLSGEVYRGNKNKKTKKNLEKGPEGMFCFLIQNERLNGVRAVNWRVTVFW